MLSFCFQSHPIRHSDTGNTFKDNQSTLEHLKHSESSRALGHSEGIRSALKALRHSDT